MGHHHHHPTTITYVTNHYNTVNTHNEHHTTNTVIRPALLLEMPTNISSLNTSGLLNSHASATTTTNVGHMHGDRSSVITLGELQELDHYHIHNHGGAVHLYPKKGDRIHI